MFCFCNIAIVCGKNINSSSVWYIYIIAMQSIFFFCIAEKAKLCWITRHMQVVFSDPGHLEISKCTANFSFSYCAVRTPYPNWKIFVPCCATGRAHACLWCFISAPLKGNCHHNQKASPSLFLGGRYASSERCRGQRR